MRRIDIPERQVRDAIKTTPTMIEAAKALGVSRRTLYVLMGRHGIEIKRIVT